LNSQIVDAYSIYLFVVLHLSPNQVPNTSPTAASASSDLYGAAVLDACEQIKARMEPVALKHNFSSFAEVMY
jgi:xanthine dehydrogenase/oxidase